MTWLTICVLPEPDVPLKRITVKVVGSLVLAQISYAPAEVCVPALRLIFAEQCSLG
jgi:hypothetical protein